MRQPCPEVQGPIKLGHLTVCSRCYWDAERSLASLFNALSGGSTSMKLDWTHKSDA